MSVLLSLFLFAAVASAKNATTSVATSARDVSTFLYSTTNTTTTGFRLTGQITFNQANLRYPNHSIVVQDETGPTLLVCSNELFGATRLHLGAKATFSGRLQKSYLNRRSAIVTNCQYLAQAPLSPAIPTTLTDLLDGKHDLETTSFSGVLREVTLSETSPGWVMLIVRDRFDKIYVSIPDSSKTLAKFQNHLGDRVTVTGICDPADPSPRMTAGRFFKTSSDDDVIVHEPLDESQAPLPSIEDISCRRDSEILALGRHTVVGKVFAVWQQNHVLLRTKQSKYVELELDEPIPPAYGQTICAIGLPESDLFQINLTHCTWSEIAPPDDQLPASHDIDLTLITGRQKGYQIVNSNFHGWSIRVSGIVRGRLDNGLHQIQVEAENQMVTVDASSVPDALLHVVNGCRVEVRGTCVLRQELPLHLSRLPQLKTFILVLRTPSDLTILSRPSWWTSRRLLSVIATLGLCLIGILIWNVSLRKLAVRKGRELMREQIRNVKASLKTEERTRLAVELHDSLAQNLTGVSMEIDTASKMAVRGDNSLLTHLDIASRSLRSCRDELRNCLWDLRNRALEENTMDAAIRQTLAPHLTDVELAVRFAVPRERISDNTAHAILRIIRELTINAIRHGHATKIWVAGSIDGEKMRFSVRDNGSGFDPKSAPGFAQGHYGLIGIQERIDEFEGDFTILSDTGSGTKATISLNVPHEN